MARDRVLELARQGVRPTGTWVGPGAEHPGGLRLAGVAALGVGLEEGDLLLSVAGTPATSEGRVVGVVLALRRRRVPVIVGEVQRGAERFWLAVEQPYPAGK